MIAQGDVRLSGRSISEFWSRSMCTASVQQYHAHPRACEAVIVYSTIMNFEGVLQCDWVSSGMGHTEVCCHHA
jgi:hypothetical protein